LQKLRWRTEFSVSGPTQAERKGLVSMKGLRYCVEKRLICSKRGVMYRTEK